MALTATKSQIPCTVRPGAFSGEVLFEILLRNRPNYQGLGPAYLFQDQDGNPLPRPLKAARTAIATITVFESGYALLPDGEGLQLADLDSPLGR